MEWLASPEILQVNYDTPLIQQCSTSSSKTNFLHNFERTEEISLEAVLKSSLYGRQVLFYYHKNKYLNLTHRKLLGSSIVQYLIEYKITPTPKFFGNIAEKIELLFPTENKDIYYIPIKGRKPAGYLYSKYHNSLSKLRKEGVYESHFKTQELEDNTSEIDLIPDESQISTKDWLKYNVEPFDIVLQKWGETFILRKSFIKENHTLTEIFEEWPLLKQSYGYKLITADFSTLYPEKINLIFENWEGFCKSILPLIQNQINGPDSLDLIKQLKEFQNNNDIRNNIILHLLHQLLKPNSRKCIIDKSSNKRKFTKTSIEDSRNAFLLWAPTNMELNSKIKVVIDELYSKKETLQPIICGIGRSVSNINEFFVFYGNVFYKLPNIVACVDVAFKLFHVLNLKYPEDCKNIWLFFQQHFYDIKIKNADKSTILAIVLNDIKTIK